MTKIVQISNSSINEQKLVFKKCRKALAFDINELNVKRHLKYLEDSLINGLPARFKALDASNPWICYWILSSLSILGASITQYRAKLSQKIGGYVDPNGGIAGGYKQIPHLMPTYAAIIALHLSKIEISDVVDIGKTRCWLWKLKQPDGSFRAQIDGEIDLRACYSALVICEICAIKDAKLFENTARFIYSCQTYEGGFAGYIGGEAHGGYTYCALAALALLESTSMFRNQSYKLKSLSRWLRLRQQEDTGGFNGRTNKLVDGCYSWWILASIQIIETNFGSTDEYKYFQYLHNDLLLQKYILNCCQSETGGLRDKPGADPDYYHTNYCLLGLALSFAMGFINLCNYDVENTKQLEKPQLLKRVDLLFGVADVNNFERKKY